MLPDTFLRTNRWITERIPFPSTYFTKVPFKIVKQLPIYWLKKQTPQKSAIKKFPRDTSSVISKVNLRSSISGGGMG